MSPRRIGLPLAAFLVLGLVGCAGRQLEGDPFNEALLSKEVKIYVTNLAFMDATLWAVTTGTRHKLGIVTGKKEAVYTMPLPFPALMHIEIDLLAGPLCYTERLTVDPGDELELIIQDENANQNWNCIRR
jgi:hypothetical protein